MLLVRLPQGSITLNVLAVIKEAIVPQQVCNLLSDTDVLQDTIA